MAAYNPSPLSEIFGGTTTDTPRVYLDVKERLSVNVLNFVDPRL